MPDHANRSNRPSAVNRDATPHADGPSPGKHTLVEQAPVAPVQRRAVEGSGALPTAVPPATGAHAEAETHAAAAQGIAGPGQALPHFDRVQPLFGRHDVSQVKAHVGGAATEASEKMGAQAYATGDHVAFRAAPDLHTAAHEAAHVVQQRGGVQLKGGVGEQGDAYERHADAVADAVVAGQPADALLDEMAPVGAAIPGPARGAGPVQRQQAPQPQAQQPAQPQQPAQAVQLGGSVGDGGANQPADVRAVQDRLLALHFLSQADHTAEQVNAQAQPGQAVPGPVVAASIPRTIAAIAAFSRTALGQPLLQITPGQIQQAALNATPVATVGTARPTGTVGVSGANNVADVRAVMDRLRAVGYLSGADHQAETTAIAAVQGAVADNLIPHTLGALLRFLRETGGSAARQVAPNSPEEAILNSPPLVHDQPTVGAVHVAGSTGAGGANARGDVRAVQDRLRALGYLAAADYAQERVNPQGQGAVADANIARTIAAIARFSQELLGPPGVQQIAPGSAAEQALNAPPHSHAPVPQIGSVALGGSVGAGGANAVADVRAVQDRLHAIGYLTSAHRTAESPAQATQGAVADAAIPQTIAAIQRFHRELLNSSLAQIRQGADEQALNNPPRNRRAAVEITTSVGTGGGNGPASVRAVQERLHDLGYLADADFTTEQANPTAPANIADAAITATRAAIQALQTTLGGGRIVASGLIQPGDASHRLLMNPGATVAQTVALTARVGRGGPNHPADVQLVQGRLRELGFLSAGDLIAERPTGAANVPDAALARTIAAIEAFQSNVVGVPPDGRIDAGGLSARLLQDPSYGTNTVANPNATNAAAGPAPANFAHEVQQIITACEIIEAGAGGRGERPAVLRNGAGTPASFGRGQLIGGTAVGTLQHNPNIAAIYGLSAQDLQDLNGIATRTAAHYDAIYALVPVHGAATDAALLALAAAYTTTHGARFHVETGLFESDIVAMFRTAQLRRHLHGQPVGAEVALMNPAQNPAAAANITALGFAASDVRHYLSMPRHLGENRQGFVTRALFTSQHGQQLRDAMTDNGGSGIGRALINDNYNLVVARAASLHVQLTVQQRAEVTARIHNQGDGGLNGFLGNLAGTHTDPYVTRFLQHWVP